MWFKIKDIMKAKFYTFRQNNSGGAFIVSKKDGISVHVIIEALNADDANTRAEEIGLYFDGCSKSMDCSCCGDRWRRTDESDGYDVPCIYGEPITNTENADYAENCYVHYLEGEFFEKKTIQ